MSVVRALISKWRVFRAFAGEQLLVPLLLRWGIWALRCLVRRPAVVEITGLGIRLFLQPRWKGSAKVIYVFRERFFEVNDAEIEFVRRALRAGDTFVDVGAFHGWYTLTASLAVGPRGRIVAFEPNPNTFPVLSRNIVLNDRANVQALNVALSDVDSIVPFYTGPDDGVASSLAQVQGGKLSGTVKTRRLDDVLGELSIGRVDLLKLDVEGVEAAVLRGGLAMLTSSRPTVVFEVNPTAASSAGASERDTWDVLVGQGYRFFRWAPSGLTLLADFPAVPEGSVLNIVAVHQAPAAEHDPRVGAGAGARSPR